MTDVLVKGIKTLAEKENEYKQQVFKEINNMKKRQIATLIFIILSLIILILKK